MFSVSARACYAGNLFPSKSNPTTLSRTTKAIFSLASRER